MHLSLRSRRSLRSHRAILSLFALLPLTAILGCASLRPYREVAGDLPPGSLIEIAGSDGRPQRVHVVDRGPRDGGAIVFLHGFGASTASWEQVQTRLSSDYRTVAIDLSGFGWTERAHDEHAYTLDGQMDLVTRVLDALGIARAHVVGHSYGGGIAQWLATGRPERVRSLILVDSTSPVYAHTRRSRAASFPPLADLFVRMVALKPSFVRRSLEGSFYDQDLVTDALVKQYLDPLKVEGTLFAYRALSKPNDSDPESFDPASIRQPILAIWGEHDSKITVATARQATSTIRDLRFVVIPGAAHNPHEEKPDETAAAIREFLPTVPNPR